MDDNNKRVLEDLKKTPKFIDHEKQIINEEYILKKIKLE